MVAQIVASVWGRQMGLAKGLQEPGRARRGRGVPIYESCCTCIRCTGAQVPRWPREASKCEAALVVLLTPAISCS